MLWRRKSLIAIQKFYLSSSEQSEAQHSAQSTKAQTLEPTLEPKWLVYWPEGWMGIRWREASQKRLAPLPPFVFYLFRPALSVRGSFAKPLAQCNAMSDRFGTNRGDKHSKQLYGSFLEVQAQYQLYQRSIFSCAVYIIILISSLLTLLQSVLFKPSSPQSHEIGVRQDIQIGCTRLTFVDEQIDLFF